MQRPQLLGLLGGAGEVAGAAFTTLIHEPASIIALVGVLVLSIALDFWWKRVRDRRASSETSTVQVGH